MHPSRFLCRLVLEPKRHGSSRLTVERGSAVDACAEQAYDYGPELEIGGTTDGCPAWRRPEGDRYFFILLDQSSRTIQVGVIHPGNIPSAMTPLLPELPSTLSGAQIDGIFGLRLPDQTSN